MPNLTPEFFEALGRLAFEFAALEQMVGLCILELDPSQEADAVWRESFEQKLQKLKRDLVTTVALVPNCTLKMTLLDDLVNDARAVGRRRNTIIHGTLQLHPGGEILLKNLAYGGTHPLDSTAIDEVTLVVERLYERFVDARGYCIRTRRLAGARS